MPQFNPSNDSSREVSTEPETQRGTETPASFLDFNIANIDPRLIDPGPIRVVESSMCLLSTDPNQAEIFIRRVIRGAAKVASLEFGPKLELLPKPSLPSSRKRGRSEEQPIRKRRGKGRPDKSKASTTKPTPRRSKRLRAQ
jgi:hypothetical protein